MEPPNIDDWEPWSAEKLATLFDGITTPWTIVGGWAIDLWLGQQTRSHKDIEISILRDDIKIFQNSLTEIDFFCAGSGKLTALAPNQTPEHAVHQVWCLDRTQQQWRLDIMMEPGTQEEWVFRRNPIIKRPRSKMTSKTPTDIPFLNPAGVLLYKAKHVRGKDEHDFDQVAQKLQPSDKDWLIGALQVEHPNHHWIERLK
jgi:Aminoglycoside-2''-adenylyltransferase